MAGVFALQSRFDSRGTKAAGARLQARSACKPSFAAAPGCIAVDAPPPSATAAATR